MISTVVTSPYPEKANSCDATEESAGSFTDSAASDSAGQADTDYSTAFAVATAATLPSSLSAVLAVSSHYPLRHVSSFGFSDLLHPLRLG